MLKSKSPHPPSHRNAIICSVTEIRVTEIGLNGFSWAAIVGLRWWGDLDLTEITDAFVGFAKEQKFSFWPEV
jgi:hypothetical protein